MRLFAPDARLGAFLLIAFRPGEKSPDLHGPAFGFETFDAADTYRKSLSLAGGTQLLIVQVTGEWRYQSMAVEVHPKD